MSAPPWPELEALFHEALARAPADRAAFLAERCAGRLDRQAEVEALVRAHERTASALEMSPTSQTQLKAGMRLGSYEVLSQLGAGSMGEVYRARDARLGRDVAIKVLPSLFLSDPERRTRFEREARVLASLNHPHIAAIYGVEEAGATLALVLELVEGLTLAERIARGGGPKGPPRRLYERSAGSSDLAIPVAEALDIARQIADALEAAHEKGIVHRDLKPANITITSAGVIKVLDFGLAKLTGAGEAGPYADDAAMSKSPTITVGGTREGVILGSAAYMSPEQARGQVIDKRADIWAFGCVLYEMLTGHQAFPGETLSDTIAAVLEREPDWHMLPATIPAGIRRLLQRCLEKDSRRRLHDIADARIELEDALSARALTRAPDYNALEGGALTAAHPAAGLKRRARLASAVAVFVLVGVGVVYLRQPRLDARVYRSSILPPPTVTFTQTFAPNARFALSPDGRRLVFSATGADGVIRLWMQSLDGVSAQPLTGTENGVMPFWSPDSRFIGFNGYGKLKTIDLAGGPPVTLLDTNGSTGGATWNREGVILFATFGNPIRRISASGGAVSPATSLDAANGETRHAFPVFLPDGRHFLYLAVGGRTTGPNGPNGIYVAALDSNERKLLLAGGSNPVYAGGYLFFLREQTLMAQRFDVERLELTGDAVPVATEVTIGGQTGMAGGFTVSEAGVLAYQTGPRDVGGQAAILARLTWFDRSGKEIGTLGEQGTFGAVELSPDGRRAAVNIFDPAKRARDIWVLDVASGLRTRFTFDSTDEYTSIWSPDASRIVFNAIHQRTLDLYQKASNGVGSQQELETDSFEKFPSDWSPDGRFMLFWAFGSGRGSDLWALPLFGDRKPFPFLQTAFNEGFAQFSPDGRKVAYASDESGRFEVYVTPFPRPGGKWQISTAGGNEPRWRGDGKEIFYVAPGGKMMATAVNGQGSALDVGASQELLASRTSENRMTFTQDCGCRFGYVGYDYDVSPDGQRFLVITLVDKRDAAAPISLVVNWPALLKK